MLGLLIKPLVRLHPRAKDYIELMRLDRPIGTYLLLWPTLWALWLAAEGVPDISTLIIFVLGVILMRAAGCVINDYADRDFDGHVERTRERPLATGRISARQALIAFAMLVGLSGLLVLLTNALTIQLAFVGVGLAALYPFCKRFTFYPQVVLGAAFSWAIPMAFAAQAGTLPMPLWLLFIANLLWTVAYDTEYAMCDREDDLRIGIKSTAILFGDADRLIIGLLQGLTLVCLLLVGARFDLGLYYYLGLLGMTLGFAWQHWLMRERERLACLQAFLSNHWAGMLVFIGLALDYALR
ncbi:4-hydroxybenzoate polyprenyltransferase [Halopseudomonas pachastrellae]|uniref:4-hydroxybenzoate octaprenyltransferase n=1 Tax=Halopseudomonas pachastrellae TaxID=254161 RepID=A0A1S8DKV2_9GAMM|nr:4-hydroxybenzoate octaprenyltransferase [Halopseudomonas pachastrellae]ONM45621.1 4-hydroxybenzoate polyprenyltransferase [Halopseudomonas pachastrellae]SFM24471.1 4-hydroxybenzoate polyprenyltransferase [Halopseudomonas pachastrellae]